MNQDRALVLDALVDYHRVDGYGFTPPGHRQGRGIDSRVREIMGRDPFRDDVLYLCRHDLQGELEAGRRFH